MDQRIGLAVIVDPCPDSFGIYPVKWIDVIRTPEADARKLPQHPFLISKRGWPQWVAAINGPRPTIRHAGPDYHER
jgi:hypothetical protein